jgi:hypothetical protein
VSTCLPCVSFSFPAATTRRSNEYRIHNAEIQVRQPNVTAEDLIDVLEGKNIVYMVRGLAGRRARRGERSSGITG